MRFSLTLTLINSKLNKIPINYQYPLSSAIYHIIAKGDPTYADFLHENGYGRGFKFFTFSQINVPFKIEGDRLRLTRPEMSFEVAFHVPEAMESFIKGLFTSEKIDIADKKSKASFHVSSVESVPNPLAPYKKNEIVPKKLKPLSPVVAGIPNERRYDDYLEPNDPLYIQNLIYNWRSKIADCFDQDTASAAILMMEIIPEQRPFKSRLITIKADTDEETKIRGWMNFELKVTAEKRFMELLLNSGIGLYNAQGMGCVEVLKD